jgi:hypothetical protein
MSESQPAAAGENLAPGVVDVNIAESSAAEPQDKGSENKSMLDAVKAALHVPGKSPTLENNQESQVDPEVKPPETEAKADETLVNSLSKQGQARFRELNGLIKAQAAELEPLKAQKAEFEKFSVAVREHQLSDDDVSVALRISGLMKKNPKEALQELQPIVQNLLRHVGYILPDDLQSDVQAGAISEQRARELAAARVQKEQGERQLEEQRDTQEHSRVEQLRNQAVRAADAWALEKKTSDPDWSLKQNRVTQLVELHFLKSKTFPQTEKEARDVFDAKLKEVESELKGLLPKPKASTVISGNASHSATPAPKSTLDVVRAAVANR